MLSTNTGKPTVIRLPSCKLVVPQTEASLQLCFLWSRVHFPEHVKYLAPFQKSISTTSFVDIFAVPLYAVQSGEAQPQPPMGASCPLGTRMMLPRLLRTLPWDKEILRIVQIRAAATGFYHHDSHFIDEQTEALRLRHSTRIPQLHNRL